MSVTTCLWRSEQLGRVAGLLPFCGPGHEAQVVRLGSECSDLCAVSPTSVELILTFCS